MRHSDVFLVVKEGAYADLLLVEGNPLESLSSVTDQKIEDHH